MLASVLPNFRGSTPRSHTADHHALGLLLIGRCVTIDHYQDQAGGRGISSPLWRICPIQLAANVMQAGNGMAKALFYLSTTACAPTPPTLSLFTAVSATVEDAPHYHMIRIRLNALHFRARVIVSRDMMHDRRRISGG